jgi:hypothetical protein
VIQTPFAALLIATVRLTVISNPPLLAARVRAVPVTPVAPPAEVEQHEALPAADLSKDLVLGAFVHRAAAAVDNSAPLLLYDASRIRQEARIMSPKKTPTQFEREQRQHERQDSDDKLISDTTATFTCFRSICRDFLDQCRDHREGVDADLAFNRVAHAIWKDRPDRAQDLVSALDEFIAARTRYLADLTALESRFAALAASNDHEHLEPVERYRDLIHRMLFPNEFPRAST